MLDLKNANNTKTIFGTNGCTSSYRCLGERIYFHGLSQRKVGLEDSKLGLVIRAMWHMKEENMTHKLVEKATRGLNHAQKEELRAKARFMPGWLIEYCPWGNPDSIAA
jgi:beta-galactosidase/beta-glucuronidase